MKKWNYYRGLINLRIKSISILIVMTLVATASEALGLSLFYPIFQYISAEGDIVVLLEQSSIWEYIINFINIFGADVSLGILLLFSFVAFLSRQIFMYIRSVYSARIGKQLEMQLSTKIFKNYLKADIEYYDSMPIGLLSNVLTREVATATSAIMRPIELITNLAMLIAFFSILIVISLEMTLVAIIVLIIASYVPKAWIQQSEVVGKKLVSTNNQLTSFLIERLKSPRLVRLSGTKEAEESEFCQLVDKQRRNFVLASVLTARTELVLEPVVILLSLVFLYLSVTMFNMSIELIGLYLLISMRLLPVVKSTMLLWQSVKNSLGSIEVVSNRFQQILNSKEDDTGNITLTSSEIEIDFNSVCYSYPSSHKLAINNVSFLVPANKTTAIVGPSGGGKSTLIDLIPRLRIPDSGTIKINGIRVEEYSTDSLRKIIAYVPQSPQIFNGSIADHIRYGNKDANDEDLHRSASLAGIDSFINTLPEKYNTLIGEDAIRLSGGQRQRLDLARALIQKAHLLILDEPTSNLDADSEDSFKNTLIGIVKETNTTIVIIAHRLPSISHADQIIVLNNGEIEEMGAHTELLSCDGWYSKAWKKQTS